MTEGIEKIVQELLEKIRHLPDGAVTSTTRLMDELGYNNPYGSDAIQAHFALLKAAEEENIFLDLSSHEGKEEGLPCLLTYTVWHDRRN